MLTKVKSIKNYTLHCLDGEIGKVKDFYFEDETWTIKYLIVNTGNWLIGRQVLISPRSIVSVNDKESCFNINLTKEQIENSPVLDSAKPVSKQFQEDFHQYFQYPLQPMGMGYGGVWNTLPIIPRKSEEGKDDEDKSEDHEWDPHLRSMDIVSGYCIQAIDEEIGYVDDFIIDTNTWWINYLEIDTKKWLTGRKFIISPKWLERVSWETSSVFINLNSEEIKESPEYTSESMLDRDFEEKLHAYYKREGYWLDAAEIIEE